MAVGKGKLITGQMQIGNRQWEWGNMANTSRAVVREAIHKRIRRKVREGALKGRVWLSIAA